MEDDNDFPGRHQRFCVRFCADVKNVDQWTVILCISLKTLHGSSPSTVSRHEEEKIFSVSEYIDYLNAFLISQRAIIRGEVGRVDHHDGYTFFTLLDTDGKALINCLVWQSKLESLGIDRKEGLELNSDTELPFVM